MTLEARVLQWINQIRTTQLKLRPLKRIKRGVPRHAANCPIANSLPGARGMWFCSHAAFAASDDGVYVIQPKFVSEFITAVDLGKYPHLECK